MLHRLDRDLVERMLEFGDRFEDWVPEDDFPVRLSEVPEAAMLLRPWAVYEYAPGDVTVRERFLRARRFELRASEIAWLEAQGRSWLTAWEVLCVTAWSEMARTVITRRCLRRRRPSRRRWPARAAPREGASCVAPGTPLVVGACLAPNARPRLSFSPLVWDRRVSS